MVKLTLANSQISKHEQNIIQFIFPGATDSNIVYWCRWNLRSRITCCFDENLPWICDFWSWKIEIKSQKSPWKVLEFSWEDCLRTLLLYYFWKLIELSATFYCNGFLSNFLHFRHEWLSFRKSLNVKICDKRLEEKTVAEK